MYVYIDIQYTYYTYTYRLILSLLPSGIHKIHQVPLLLDLWKSIYGAIPYFSLYVLVAESLSYIDIVIPLYAQKVIMGTECV